MPIRKFTIKCLFSRVDKYSDKNLAFDNKNGTYWKGTRNIVKEIL